MTSFSTLVKSFTPGFRPDLQLNQMSAARAKKSCCWNNKELEKELVASNNALSWIQANQGVGATNAEIKSIFQNVSGRKRYYQRMTSGIWGWLLSLLRCRTTNRQLKSLAATLSSIHQVVIHSPSFKHLIVSELQRSDAKQGLFKQLAKEFPQLIISKTPKTSDFGLSKNQTLPNVPFLLYRTKNQIEVAFAPSTPTTAPTIKKVSDLKKLPELFSDTIESKFFEVCKKNSCTQNELIFNATNTPPPADKILLTLEKDPAKGTCTLVAQLEHVLDKLQTYRYDLSLESAPEKAQEWIDGLVNKNRAELNRVNQLSAQDTDFKIDWVARRFTANIAVGIHRETFFSSDLSTEAFNHAKSLKETFVQNWIYLDSLQDVGGTKHVSLGSGLSVAIEVKSNGDYELILPGISAQAIQKTVPKNEVLKDAVEHLKVEYELEAIIRNRSYFLGLPKDPLNPDLAVINLTQKDVTIQVTPTVEGYEIKLSRNSDTRFCVLHISLAEKLEGILDQIKQNPQAIIYNLLEYENNQNHRSCFGDYSVRSSLISQKNDLPLLNISLYHSQRPQPQVLFEFKIDSRLYQNEYDTKLSTCVPKDYMDCYDLLCTQAEMNAWQLNQIHFDAVGVYNKAALSVERVDQKWLYQARIYDLATRTVKTHTTSRPIIADPTFHPIRNWIESLLDQNRNYVHTIKDPNDEFPIMWTGKSNLLEQGVRIEGFIPSFDKYLIVKGHGLASQKKLKESVEWTMNNSQHCHKNYHYFLDNASLTDNQGVTYQISRVDPIKVTGTPEYQVPDDCETYYLVQRSEKGILIREFSVYDNSPKSLEATILADYQNG